MSVGGSSESIPHHSCEFITFPLDPILRCSHCRGTVTIITFISSSQSDVVLESLEWWSSCPSPPYQYWWRNQGRVSGWDTEIWSPSSPSCVEMPMRLVQALLVHCSSSKQTPSMFLACGSRIFLAVLAYKPGQYRGWCGIICVPVSFYFFEPTWFGLSF